MNKIYVLKKGKYMYGPYTLEELKNNNPKIGDKVWYEGLKDWIPVEKFEHLATYELENEHNEKVKKTFFKRIFGL